MEAIYKLQPHRTIHLRGFDGRGAAAALYAASDTGFTVSGVFRDAADFAVLIVYDADCFFEHPRMKYLPDFDFSGMVLTFDVRYRNLQPLDSPKFPDIDWPFLDVIRADGSTAQVRLFDHATLVGGSYEHASGSFTIVTPGAAAFDRVTLWFQNVAYDFISAAGGETAAQVATALATLINTTSTGGTYSFAAVATGATIAITANPAGYDGNMITMYAISKNANLTTSAPTTKFTGGSSDATWRVSLDFSGLAIDQARQMWLTFAPLLADSAAYAGAEWDAVFSNWSVSDPKNVRPLKVAAQNSVRVEETDAGVKCTGAWPSEAGFFSQGFARVSHSAGDSLTVTYNCQVTHDLWLGTSLYSDRGKLGVSLDGDAESVLDCYLAVEPSVVTRRKLRSAIAPGRHTLLLTVRAAGPCYFDFIEAVVSGDVPDAPGDFPLRSPALDYDTDHTYKNSPQRILWWYDSLGLSGPMNEYIGVFWWNQRKVIGAALPSATVTFGGVFAPGDQAFITIGGQAIGKTVFPADTLATIAAHFAYFINATYSGVWASAAGPVLAVSARAATAAFSFSLSAAAQNSVGAPSAAGTVAIAGSLDGGTVGTWVIDDAQDPPLNYAVRQWHADFYAEVAKRTTYGVRRTVVSSYSMELVDPPGDWIARFPDGGQVLTDTGFASLKSAQCAPMQSGFSAYQTRVYIETAQLMAAAGLAPEVQFGEFLWWFFPGGKTAGVTSGMAYYDAETTAAALTALGRPLHTFLTSNDDPNVNGGADADFLAGRLAGHVAAIAAAVRTAVPGTLLELLWPADVNAPKPTGIHGLGGRLNYWVNLPNDWKTKGVLDRIKIEALDWGSGTRSLDLALAAIRLPGSLGWPLASIRYLYPVFNGGCPWEAEYLLAVGERIPATTPFAMDHCLLLGWRVEEPTLAPGAQLV